MSRPFCKVRPKILKKKLSGISKNMDQTFVNDLNVNCKIFIFFFFFSIQIVLLFVCRCFSLYVCIFCCFSLSLCICRCFSLSVCICHCFPLRVHLSLFSYSLTPYFAGFYFFSVFIAFTPTMSVTFLTVCLYMSPSYSQSASVTVIVSLHLSPSHLLSASVTVTLTVCICHRHSHCLYPSPSYSLSASVTVILTVCICHRHTHRLHLSPSFSPSTSVTFCICPHHTICHRHAISAIYISFYSLITAYNRSLMPQNYKTYLKFYFPGQKRPAVRTVSLSVVLWLNTSDYDPVHRLRMINAQMRTLSRWSRGEMTE